MESNHDESGSTPEEFQRLARKRDVPLVVELFQFLGRSRKLWLTPVIVFALLLAALLVLSGTVAAPFIYTLF